MPKIRRLFWRHQVEITNHSTAPHTDTVSICAPPEYISQTSTTEQDESQATQEKIPTEDPTPDPDGLVTRGEQESNTLLSAITSSIEVSAVNGLVGYKFELRNQPIAHLKLRTGSGTG